MPGCLFVVSGRSRLQWADPALHGQLEYTGPTAWPGLTTTPGTVPAPRTPGGRQHLLGHLSAEDCDDHLARPQIKDGQPLITPAARTEITERSHGPHIDL
ncbi:ATP/GTP-binding protein, partial [Streptomyces sp. G44]|nr:ATP/GTP-binding protein [Streptomyces sp. G44]